MHKGVLLMKNKIIFSLFLITCLFAAAEAQAFCLVSSESGSVSNQYSLPYMLTQYSGKKDWAKCGTDGNDPLDHGLGFNQAIIFAEYISSNEEWQWTDSETKQPLNVKKVTLAAPLTFDNANFNLVIGNWPMVKPDASAYAYKYLDTYQPVTADYGMVTIDGRTSFQDKQSPFECKADTKEVVLRNLVIETKGLSKTTLFDANTCLRDGGAVYVCDGEAVAAPGQSGWCKPAGTGGNTGGNTGGSTVPVSIPPACSVEVTGPTSAKQGATMAYAVKVKKLNSTFIADNNELILIKDEKGRVLVKEGAVNKDGSIDANSDLKLEKDGLENASMADGKGYSTVAVGVIVSKTAKVEDKKITISAHSFYYADNYKGTGKGSFDFYSCETTANLKVEAAIGEYICDDKIDNDGDGKTDCDDSDCASASACKPLPETETICNDKKTNDKDALIDCGDPDCAGKDGCPVLKEVCVDKAADGKPIDPIDDDKDGKTNCGDEDCANDAACKPKEKCDDKDDKGAALDNDGDGKANCDDSDCSSNAACSADNTDSDKDGVTKNGGDCNDSNPAQYPGAKDQCANGVDEDCSGGDAACNESPLDDNDGDGFCEGPVECDDDSLPGDCDDFEKNVHPDTTDSKVPEVCDDDKDNNCDGLYGVANPDAAAAPAGTGGTTAPTTLYKSATPGAGQTFDCVTQDIIDPPGDAATGGGCGCDLTSHRDNPSDVLPQVLLAIFSLALVQVVRARAVRRS